MGVGVDRYALKTGCWTEKSMWQNCSFPTMAHVPQEPRSFYSWSHFTLIHIIVLIPLNVNCLLGCFLCTKHGKRHQVAILRVG